MSHLAVDEVFHWEVLFLYFSVDRMIKRAVPVPDLDEKATCGIEAVQDCDVSVRTREVGSEGQPELSESSADVFGSSKHVAR